MTVAAVEICESNTVSETVEHNVSNLNWGNSDAPNLAYATYPVTAGLNAYEKYIRLHVTAINDSNKIDNIQIWKSAGAYVTDESIQTNLKTSAYSAKSFATPSTTTFTDQTMPVADPGAANLGISGSLTGSLTGAGYSDYWVFQIQIGVSAPPGNTNQKTFTIQYDEQ